MWRVGKSLRVLPEASLKIKIYHSLNANTNGMRKQDGMEAAGRVKRVPKDIYQHFTYVKCSPREKVFICISCYFALFADDFIFGKICLVSINDFDL